MKPFSFRLESILNYRNYLEKRAQIELFNANNEHLSIIKEIKRLDKKKQKMAKKCSVVNFFAECPPESVVRLDPNLIYHSEITLVGSYSSTPPDLRAALVLIHSGRIDTGGLITHRLPLDALQKAFDLAVDAQESLKIIINP